VKCIHKWIQPPTDVRWQSAWSRAQHWWKTSLCNIHSADDSSSLDSNLPWNSPCLGGAPLTGGCLSGDTSTTGCKPWGIKWVSGFPHLVLQSKYPSGGESECWFHLVLGNHDYPKFGSSRIASLKLSSNSLLKCFSRNALIWASTWLLHSWIQQIIVAHHTVWLITEKRHSLWILFTYKLNTVCIHCNHDLIHFHCWLLLWTSLSIIFPFFIRNLFKCN